MQNDPCGFVGNKLLQFRLDAGQASIALNVNCLNNLLLL